MNLGVSGQAQRKKKEKKRRRNKGGDKKANQPSVFSNKNAPKLFQTKIIKVEQRKVGLIIGQSGKNIKELYERTHCDIITPRPTKKPDDDEEDDEHYELFPDGNYYYVYDAYDEANNTKIKEKKKNEKQKKKNDDDDQDEDEKDLTDPKRLIEIKLRGTPEEIRDAEVEINFMIKHGRLMLDHERDGDENKKKKKWLHKNDDHEYLNDHDEIALDIRVPSKICGMLIGGGGQKIKEVSKLTGCDIWVDWDKESHIEAGVSTVHLKGTKYSVDHAKREIRRIQQLFEKGSNNFRFEIPSFCARDLFGDHGANLKKLQKEYGVTINVKNFKYERRRIKIGGEDQRVQHTMMISLIGESDDIEACRLAIDDLVGVFVKCRECKNLKKTDEGKPDTYSGKWFCQDCWDEFNGVKKEDDNKPQQPQYSNNILSDNNKQNDNAVANRFGMMNLNQSQNQQYPRSQYNQQNNQGGGYNNQGGGQRSNRRNKW